MSSAPAVIHIHLSMDGSLVKSIFRTMCLHCWGGGDARSKPSGLAVGWENLQACHWQWEMGNEAMWEKHLATDRSCHAFFVKWKLLKSWKIRKQNHCTNRFKWSSKDLVLMCNSSQQRQEAQAVTGSRCQNVRLEAGSSSALHWAEGVEGGDLCTSRSLQFCDTVQSPKLPFAKPNHFL